MKRHRSVLSRLERIKILHERGSIDTEESSLFGLPKVKHLKIRVRKEKAATPAAGTAAGTGTVASTSTPAAPGAPASGSKPAAKTAGSSKSEAGAAPKKKE